MYTIINQTLNQLKSNKLTKIQRSPVWYFADRIGETKKIKTKPNQKQTKLTNKQKYRMNYLIKCKCKCTVKGRKKLSFYTWLSVLVID